MTDNWCFFNKWQTIDAFFNKWQTLLCSF